MFGSLKKKLQEAIAKVTAPKKAEIEQEIRKEEAEQIQKEVKEEIQHLETREQEMREVMKGLPADKERKLKDLEEDLEAKLEKEEAVLEAIEEHIREEKQEDVEQIAREEFENIAKQEYMKKEGKRGFISNIVKKIAEKTLEEKDIHAITKNLELALLENDTALEATEKICADVKKSLVGKSVKRGDVEKAVKDALKSAMLEVMKQEKIDIEKLLTGKQEPLLIMFLGFNGTGKTTSLAKLAYKLKKYKPVIAAGDTFRAASIEQLEEHGSRLGIEVIKHKYGADSAAVIFDARSHAKAAGSKLVLADTAGRSHSNVNLMDELKKVVRVNKPDIKILVLDSVTGNDIYEQARLFNEAVGVDGVILTKADVYDKGGAALSAAYTIKKPILYLGTGQEYEDLKEFVPEEVVENLLGE